MEMRWWMLLCSKWRGPLLWRAFFRTVVVVVVLCIGIVWCKQGHCGLLGEGGLIIFDVSGNPPNIAGNPNLNYGLHDLLPIVILKVVGSVLESLFNQINGVVIMSNKCWFKK
jgi:chloride channel 7